MNPPYLFFAFKLAKSLASSSRNAPPLLPETLFACTCRKSLGENFKQEPRECCSEDNDKVWSGKLRRIIDLRIIATWVADFFIVSSVFCVRFLTSSTIST